MGFVEDEYRKKICLQHTSCFQCPLSVVLHVKGCRELTIEEMKLLQVVDDFVDGDYSDAINWLMKQKGGNK